MLRSELKRTGFKPTEPKPAKGPRQHKCSSCSELFVRQRMGQKVCGPACALSFSARVAEQKAKKAARAERAADKLKLLALEPLEYYLKKAERACNAYIRARDMGNGCISCGRHDAEVWNAGHFIAVGANKTLRFDEDNIHLQCARPCNKDKGGNIHEYRKALLIKIGAERLERLDGWHPPVKMTREAAEAVEAHYKSKLKQLKEQQA